jgi:hypothetical protein
LFAICGLLVSGSSNVQIFAIAPSINRNAKRNRSQTQKICFNTCFFDLAWFSCGSGCSLPQADVERTAEVCFQGKGGRIQNSLGLFMTEHQILLPVLESRTVVPMHGAKYAAT